MMQEMIDTVNAHPERIKFCVVQMSQGEPISAVGPFDNFDVAEGWITQHKALADPSTGIDMVHFFTVGMVLP